MDENSRHFSEFLCYETQQTFFATDSTMASEQWKGILRHRDSGIRLTGCESKFTFPPDFVGQPFPVCLMKFTCNCKDECSGLFICKCKGKCLCCPTRTFERSNTMLYGEWMLDAVSRYPKDVMLVVRDEYRECSSCSAQIVRGDKNSMMCGGCKLVRYCSRNCQKQHWVAHKRYCSLTKSELESSVPVAINLMAEYNSASCAKELKANIERRKREVEKSHVANAIRELEKKYV